MPFKIAYGAGHRLVTAGKRFPAALDPAQTREWTVNDRVARYFAEAAAEYEGVELLRVDDPAGVAPISVEERNRAANQWGADFCLSIHHNSAGKVFNGGGVVAYVGPGVDSRTRQYQRALYDAVIAATGLKGNRAAPLATANLAMCNGTVAPAVLMELGFMDSTADAPIILTDAFSRSAGYALMEGIAAVAGLEKKKGQDTLYRVQVGAYRNKANAEAMKAELESKGYAVRVVTVERDTAGATLY